MKIFFHRVTYIVLCIFELIRKVEIATQNLEAVIGTARPSLKFYLAIHWLAEKHASIKCAALIGGPLSVTLMRAVTVDVLNALMKDKAGKLCL